MTIEKENALMQDIKQFRIVNFDVCCFNKNREIIDYKVVNGVMTKSFVNSLLGNNNILFVNDYSVEKNCMLRVKMLFFDERDAQIFIDKIITINNSFINLQRKLDSFANSIL